MSLAAAFLTGLTGRNTAQIAERPTWSKDMTLADPARKRRGYAALLGPTHLDPLVQFGAKNQKIGSQ